jgi:hypothetical protein
MEACGAALVLWEGDLAGTDHVCAE